MIGSDVPPLRAVPRGSSVQNVAVRRQIGQLTPFRDFPPAVFETGQSDGIFAGRLLRFFRS